MNPEPDTADGFGLREILRALRRRWWIVAICAIVTPAAALAFSLAQEKLYSATATLLFEDSQVENDLVGLPASFEDTERKAATNTALANLDVLYDRTEAELQREGIEFPAVDVSVEQSGVDDLAQITAIDPDPKIAALTANIFAREYVKFRREGDRESLARALELVQRRLVRLRRTLAPAREIEELRDRQRDLANLQALQTGGVRQVERAQVPEAASSPRTRRNVALGVFLGLLLGLALALLVDRLDRRIRDESEIGDSVDAPVLGVVPLSKAIERQKGGLEALRPSDVEAFRLLRAELRYFEASKDASCVLVTSSAPGEGKSTVAWNLALCAAESGARTLLIEADLRRPVLALKMGATPGERGLSTVLSEQVTFADAVQRYGAGENEAQQTFDVLYAGPAPPNPADLLESDNMEQLLVAARREYDYVVIDTAPVAVVSDAIPLLGRIDGVLVVTRLGTTRRDELGHLRGQLTKFSAPVLGVVINGGSRGTDYGGYASYGYAGGSTGAGQPALVARPAATEDPEPSSTET